MISINNEKVFVNRIDKKIHNNEEVYYSKEERKKDVKKITKNVYQKINDIFTSKNYIYKADVVIVTKDSTLNKTIIGKNKNHLITIDNELIPISEIVDIYKEKGSSN